MGGGAWPFLVGGVICLVNSVNERDLSLLTRLVVRERRSLLRGTLCVNHKEVWGNNRSVMPLDVLGRTRATLTPTASTSQLRKVLVISNRRRDGDRSLELLILNEECLVSASHQLALITSLPFVHTARRSYRFRVVRWIFRTASGFVPRAESQVNLIT